MGDLRAERSHRPSSDEHAREDRAPVRRATDGAADVPVAAPSGLVVGAADDPFEHEAHRVADALLAGHRVSVTPDPGGTTVGRSAQGGDLSGSFEPDAGFAAGLSGLGAGKQLPDDLRSQFSAGLGMGLDHVRVHTGGRADTLNRSIGARAFTLGSDIVVGGGGYAPGTPAGDRLLAHEVAHVAQQAGSAGSPVRTLRRYLYQEIVDQFAPGDLMYGLSMARTDTQGPVKAKMRLLDRTGGNAQQAASVLDELNNYFVGTSGYQETDAAKYGSDYGSVKPGYKPDKGVQDQAMAFKLWLEQDRDFGPIFTGLQPVRNKAVTDRHRTWERIKQVCLGGLKYTVTSDHKIYFILDGINMSDVVQELNWEKSLGADQDVTKRVNDLTGDTREDITPNELRFVFEHWTEARFNTKITFWRRGQQVVAPWEEQPKLWQKYADRNSADADEPAKVKNAVAVGTTSATKLADLRTGVLARFGAGNYVFGSKAALQQGVTMEETTGLSRGSLIKKAMGLSALDALRQQAKDLDPALPPDRLSAEIQRIATAAVRASDPGTSTKFMDARLAMARKTAFYLWQRVPAADVETSMVFQAQDGITGQSKRSTSPTAVLVMGPSPEARAKVLPLFAKKLSNHVRANPAKFAAMLPSAQKRGATDADDERRGAAISARAADRAVDKNRNVFVEGTGASTEEFGVLLDKLRGTDYRIEMVLAPGTIVTTDAVACQQLEKMARNFQSLQSMAHVAYVIDGTVVDWRSGNGGTPYSKIREKLGAADVGVAPRKGSEDPNFEMAAMQFEERLGAYAFAHPVANKMAADLADKVDTYLAGRSDLYQEYVDAGKDAASLLPEAAWKKMGVANVRFAGAVGTEVLAVKAALRTGNLRERLLHIHNFVDSVLGQDVMDGTKRADIKRVLLGTRVRGAEISARGRRLGPKGKLSEDVPDGSSLNIQSKVRSKNPNGSAQSSRTAKEVVGLSDAEKSHQGLKGDDDVVQWNEGVKAWLIEEHHAWAKLHLTIGTPVAAGPSSHTNAFMQIAHLLDVNRPDDMRLAVIGHLLPIRAHSLVEIMEAAKPHGATAYASGRGMYRTLSPLTIEELRANVAEKRLFPDELIRRMA